MNHSVRFLTTTRGIVQMFCGDCHVEMKFSQRMIFSKPRKIGIHMEEVEALKAQIRELEKYKTFHELFHTKEVVVKKRFMSSEKVELQEAASLDQRRIVVSDSGKWVEVRRNE